MRFLRMAVTLGCPLLKMKPRLVFGWRPLDHLQRQSSLDVAMHLYLSERMSPKIAILVVWTKKEKQAKVNSILSLMMFNQWRIRSPEYKLFMFQIMFLAWCRFTEFIHGSTVDEKAARTLAKKNDARRRLHELTNLVWIATCSTAGIHRSLPPFGRGDDQASSSGTRLA